MKAGKRSLHSIDRNAARRTCLVFAVALAGIAIWQQFLSGRSRVAAVLATAALAIFLLSRIAPPFAQLFHRYWMALATVLGWVNSRVLLGLVYFLAVTPYGLLLRMLRRSTMRDAKRAHSYWIPRTEPRQPHQRFTQLY